MTRARRTRWALLGLVSAALLGGTLTGTSGADAAAPAAARAAGLPTGEKPNILLITTDDRPWVTSHTCRGRVTCSAARA